MERSDGVVAAAPPANAAVARRDSGSAASNGGAATRSSTSAASSSRHASSAAGAASSSSSSSASAHRSSSGSGAAGASSASASSNSHGLSRRNSSNERDARDSSSRDHHREASSSSSRESRHSSRDSRDRDSRSTSQRSRSPRESSRDRRSDRDRDRDRGSGGGSGGGSSSSHHHHHHSSSSHFTASGNPVARLRERNNILVMHRTATRRSNLSPAEVALRVFGLDAQYMKDQESPNISDKLGLPGVFPTNMNFPEEKFRVHAVRGVAFVNDPPRGFGSNWHLQYSFFTDKKFPVFDEVARAASVIDRIDKTEAGELIAAPPASQPQADPPFASYLIRNVRRIDERISNQWMSELASGKKTIPELVQSYGVPFKQWRPVPNVSKCPLLDFVVRFRPGFAEATWFIRVNVIYVELNEIKRDCTIRQGDWFHNPRRFQRHALGWTEQLVDYMHALARQDSEGMKKAGEVNDTKSAGMKGNSSLLHVPTSSATDLKNHLHTDAGIGSGSVPAQPAAQASTQAAQLSVREKWSYVLKLSEYQYKLGLLHGSRYFDGLLSLLQKALSPRGRAGIRPSLLLLGVNEIMELMAVIQSLLPDLLLSSDGGLLLIKTLLQHLRYLLPPGTNISEDAPLQEEFVVAICQMLRGILLNNHDLLVRLEENGPHMWPSCVFSHQFFDHTAFGPQEIDACVTRCLQLSREVSGRIARVQTLCSPVFTHAATRNEVQVIQTLDRFHRVDANLDVSRVYHEIFSPLSSFDVGSEIPVDTAGIFLVCEWAVTVHRPSEYRYLSALALLEMHSKVLLEFGREHEIVESGLSYHHLVLQGALQSFLQQYQLKAISEATQLIEFFCLLVRRRLFSVESFVGFASNVVEATAHEGPIQAPLMSPSSNRMPPSSAPAVTSATMVSTAYNIECGPGRGYKASEISLLTTPERLRLYLWQLPRGPFPMPTCLPMIPETVYDSELDLLRWLEVMDVRQEHLSYSKTLERAQTLCVYVFHTHGEVNDPNEPSNKDRVMKEIEYQGKVSDLVSAVKTMCGHDKGRFTLWFLKNIYEEPSFFRFSELGGVEQVVRLVCLVLEIVDILALLEVIIYFLRRSPAFLVKNVILAMIERHEIAFCVTEQIPLLIQTFIDRFKGLEKLADDKTGSIARFFCKMFNAHSKKIGTPDLPFALIKAIAEVARKNNQEANQKPKELSLEATNLPPVRIPTARETIPPEVKSALSRSFKALQARSFSDGSDGKANAVSTPLASPDSQSSQTSATEPSYEAPLYSTLVWKEVVTEASDASESKSRDGAVDFAATAVNMSMSSSMGATNANATRERRTPNYIFVLRAVLSEVMDKWMANINARTKTNNRRSMMTPQYIHRCVRFLREIVEQHPEGEDFQEKFANTLLQWLQKEVIPGFAGSETQRRVRNPFIKIETENGKEAFLLNQRGRLEKLQYGLKAFIVSLIVHKVVDLSQVLRLALFPIFPRLRRASRDPAPNLPSQLLAMALVYQLFSEPPPNVMLDQQRSLIFDEAMTKYHLRFMRSQVPAGLMFPLVHLLCQISYQMEENHTLRRRDERGNLASSALFNLTADPIVREIIFHDTKEAREKHVLPVFNKKQWQWHTAVLMTHFFRPPNAPAEEAPNQVQLLKVDQIVDQMTVWGLNRGGSIYLDLQICRQQQKATGKGKKNSSRQSAKRKATSDLPSNSSKRARSSHMNGSSAKFVQGSQDDEQRIVGYLDAPSSDEEEAVDIEVETTGSATEILASLIVVRTLRSSSRPKTLKASTTLCSVSPISMPHLFKAAIKESSSAFPMKLRCIGHNMFSSKHHHLHAVEVTGVESAAEVGEYEAQEAAVASLYAAMICNISRRTMGSVIAKILQILEDDAKCMRTDNHPGLKINGSTVVRLISGVMCTPPGSAFLPRYMMSVATQLESLYEVCMALDDNAHSSALSTLALRRLRRKLAIRLQLVVVIGQGKHLTQTICYRNRIVKTLFYFLGTSTTNRGAGLSLFSWILDLIPYVRSSILHDKHSELVTSLNLPPELKRRVWSLFPRPVNGAEAVYIRDSKSEALFPVDPWGLLEHAVPLPSDNLFMASQVVQPKRRRVFRCV